MSDRQDAVDRVYSLIKSGEGTLDFEAALRAAEAIKVLDEAESVRKDSELD